MVVAPLQRPEGCHQLGFSNKGVKEKRKCLEKLFKGCIHRDSKGILKQQHGCSSQEG